MRQLAYGFVLILLVACATASTPAQRVFQIQNNYNAGLAVAVAYKALPTCGPGITPVCKKDEVVKELQDADNIAAPALDTAQKAVRTGTLDVAQTAVIAAQAAVAALTAITARLVIKEAQ